MYFDIKFDTMQSLSISSLLSCSSLLPEKGGKEWCSCSSQEQGGKKNAKF
jgi:hypothetical protein